MRTLRRVYMISAVRNYDIGSQPSIYKFGDLEILYRTKFADNTKENKFSTKCRDVWKIVSCFNMEIQLRSLK